MLTGADGLAEALADCGVAAQDVEIEWDDLAQDFVVSFTSEQAPDPDLDRLAALCLRFGSRFVFPNPELQAAFDRSVRASPVMARLLEELKQDRQARIRSAGLEHFPAYDPSRESVEEFAVRTEAACGFPAGTELLTASKDTLVISTLGLAPPEMERLSLILALIDEAAPCLRLLMTGSATEE